MTSDSDAPAHPLGADQEGSLGVGVELKERLQAVASLTQDIESPCKGDDTDAKPNGKRKRAST